MKRTSKKARPAHTDQRGRFSVHQVSFPPLSLSRKTAAGCEEAKRTNQPANGKKRKKTKMNLSLFTHQKNDSKPKKEQMKPPINGAKKETKERKWTIVSLNEMSASVD